MTTKTLSCTCCLHAQNTNKENGASGWVLAVWTMGPDGVLATMASQNAASACCIILLEALQYWKKLYVATESLHVSQEASQSQRHIHERCTRAVDPLSHVTDFFWKRLNPL